MWKCSAPSAGSGRASGKAIGRGKRAGRMGEGDWRGKPRRAFLGIFSHPGGSPAEEAESAEKSGKLGVSATRRWIHCGATDGSGGGGHARLLLRAGHFHGVAAGGGGP